jgi:hypothetical protein
MTRNNKYEGTIGSATAVMKSNGEIFAKPHPHKLTGYKAKNSETNTKTLGSSTYEQLAAKRMHQTGFSALHLQDVQGIFQCHATQAFRGREASARPACALPRECDAKPVTLSSHR